MRWYYLALLTLVVCGVPWGIVVGLRAIPDASAKAPTVSYAELVAILLTGITVVLAVLALLVGGLAIWGYQTIKAAAITMVKADVDRAVSVHAKF